MGPIPQSDDSYPIRALHALEEAAIWIGLPNADPRGGDPLYSLLEQMKHHTEFQPVWCSNEQLPLVVGDKLEYRLPVWEIFAEVFGHEAPHSIERIDERLADWFQTLLSQTLKSKVLQQELDTFSKKLSAAGVDVVVDNSGPPAAVWIHIDPEQSGDNAKVVAKRIIPELIERMRKHIEQGRT